MIYKTLKDGALQSEKNTYIPAGHRFYIKALDEAAKGISTIEPYEPDPEENSFNSKFYGIEFDGVMCSATREDQWGLGTVKSHIEAGNSVNFEFSNGNTLTITPANLAAFEAIWMPFRQSFFV